jgi:hypothetical protein
MSLVVRASVELKPGCTLIYDPPFGGEDFRARAFFDKHRGTRAMFVNYSEKLVAPLDHLGRLPGRYINQQNILVKFDGDEVHKLNTHHFIVDDIKNAMIVNPGDANLWLGPLPHRILFYPGDSVMFKKRPRPGLSLKQPYLVNDIFIEQPFTNDGVPRYSIIEPLEESAKR